MAGDGQPGLPPFQLEVARMFFARLVRGRTASVLRGLAIGAHGISRVPPDPG